MTMRQIDLLVSDVVFVLLWTEYSYFFSLLFFVFHFVSAAGYLTWRDPFYFGAHVTSFHLVYLGGAARRISLEFQ